MTATICFLILVVSGVVRINTSHLKINKIGLKQKCTHVDNGQLDNTYQLKSCVIF